MATRPQCNVIAMTFTAEAAYGTAVTDAAIDKRYDPQEPILLGLTKTKVDDADRIKGHEFPTDPDNKDIIIARDIEIPFSFDSSVEILGLMCAIFFGADSVTGAPSDFTHTYKAANLCVLDQFPSVSWFLGQIGDTASFFKVKGVLINELRLVLDGQGFLTVSGTAMTDGSLELDAGFTFPTLEHPTDYIVGTEADFLTADAGSSVVTKKPKLRGFELSMTNNLDVSDARSNVAAAGVNLASLRAGQREYSLTITVEGHQGDEFWQDMDADVEKDVQLLVSKSGTREISIDINSCKIENVTQRFDGIRDVMDLQYKLFYNTSDASPIVIIVKNKDAAYLI